MAINVWTKYTFESWQIQRDLKWFTKIFWHNNQFESVNNLETFGHFQWLYYALLQGIFQLKLKPIIIYSLLCCSKACVFLFLLWNANREILKNVSAVFVQVGSKTTLETIAFNLHLETFGGRVNEDNFHFHVNYPFKSVVFNRGLKMTSNN